MIEDEVVQIAGEFSALWSDVLQDFPVYRFDFTWPSVGTVDYLLAPLRGKETFSETEDSLIRGAAAYLAGIAHDCWSTFPAGAKVRVFVQEHGDFDIVIRVSGGDQLRDHETFEVRIYSTLQQLISKPANPFPTFADSERFINPDSNLLSLFASGLVSGLCPYGKGPWTGRSVKRFAPYLQTVCSHLAASSASYCQRVFPADHLGVSAKLYYPHLILPPAGYGERYVGVRAAAGLIDSLKGANASEDEMRRCVIGLASTPDDLISLGGFAVASALCETPVPERLRAQGWIRQISCPALRSSMKMARTLLGKKDSWLSHLKEKEFTEAKRELSIERQLKYIPLLYLDKLDYIEDPLLDEFFHFVSWSHPKEAAEALGAYIEIKTLPAELRLQHIYLLLVLNQLDQAKAELSSLAEESDALSEPNDQFKFLELQGLIAERNANPEETADNFKKAFAIRNVNTDRLSSVGNWLAMYYTARNQFSEAQTVLERILKMDSANIPAQVNRLVVLLALQRYEELERLLQRLVLIAPNSPSVFSFAKDYLLSKKLEDLKSESEESE